MDRYGVTKMHLDMDDQVERWQEILTGVSQSVIRKPSIFYDKEHGIGTLNDIERSKTAKSKRTNQSNLSQVDISFNDNESRMLDVSIK